MLARYYTCISIFVFFFNDTATTEIYTLSLHDAFRSARCGSVRKPVTYQGKPGRPECWRVGDTERIEESTKASTALETAERPRREAQSRGAGQPEARTGLLEQGPSNSYFGGPYFISQDFMLATRTEGPRAEGPKWLRSDARTSPYERTCHGRRRRCD